MNFEKSKQIGREAEVKVKSALEARGKKVEDVTENKEYWAKDIDFKVAWEDGESATIEVKADRRISETGNLCIELITNVAKQREGWISKCEADYIFYVDLKKNLSYCFALADLTQFLKERSRLVRVVHTKESHKQRVLGLISLNLFRQWLDTNNLYFQILELPEVA